MLEKVIIISCIVFAIWYSMTEGEIFEKLGVWFSKHLPAKIHSPVFECPVCMVPYYGSAVYWVVWGADVKEWIVTIIAAMGVNVVITRFFPDE